MYFFMIKFKETYWNKKLELFIFKFNYPHRYGLSKLTYQGSMKSQLTLMSREKPQIKSVIMGTRATDPRCHNLKPFAPTDGDWPPYVRVNPILVNFCCCIKNVKYVYINCVLNYFK